MRLVSSLLLISVISCGTAEGDPHSNNGIPPVGGKDKRIRDVADPGIEGHAGLVKTTQPVSGALVVAVDEFDETQNGKSAGTIYVQDLDAMDPETKQPRPYSGITLFAPTFNPGNLAVSPGDVLDLRGQYTESATIGSTVTFAPGSVLPQISQPVATFRYETKVPDPVDIDAADLADFAKGRRWLGMLVRIKNVTLLADAVNDSKGSGRLAVNLSEGTGGNCQTPFPKPASLTNDLFDVDKLGLKKGTTLKSITGVVGFFCNLKLAPRSKADLQQ
ncbi:MAG: hypothetical protein JWP87_3646 [Labilithrix sp.]|nr:hypothetical protein [Labilithrix sp.]